MSVEEEYNAPDFEEYPPLLPIGRHELTLRRIRELCVDRFPGSTARAGLMEILEGIVARLKAARVRGELWIGGSFVTEKPEPGDIDVVLRARFTWLLGAGEEQRDAVHWFVDDLDDSERMDNYLLV